MTSFEKFFAPKSVAVIGVSEKPGKIGHEVFRSIVSSNYKGQAYAINPRTPRILGIQSHNSLQDTPLEINKLFPVLRDVNTQKPVLCGAFGGPYTRKMAQELTSLTGVQVFETPVEWVKAAWALSEGNEVAHRLNSL